MLLENQVYIDRSVLPPALVNRLVRRAAFQNPENFGDPSAQFGINGVVTDQRPVGQRLPAGHAVLILPSSRLEEDPRNEANHRVRAFVRSRGRRELAEAFLFDRPQ